MLLKLYSNTKELARPWLRLTLTLSLTREA